MLDNKTRSPFTYLYVLTARELWRSRFGLILLVVIPPLFLATVEWTSGDVMQPINVFFWKHTEELLLSSRDVSLVFIAAAVCGFLSAYYAILLFHRDFDYFQYCIGMGLSPLCLLGARFAFFLTVVASLAIFMSITLVFMTELNSSLGVTCGFVLVGIVYGAYGGVVGLMSKDFMVAILCVILLANLDAGWLQNPVFYTSSQETAMIHWLPAFNPTQVIFTAAFTEDVNGLRVLLSLGYGGVLMAAMILVWRIKLRSIRRWWR